jgi:large subunit ribosomal protein L24
MEKETPIHVSNVMLFCSECGQGVRVRNRTLEDGSKTRFCAKCETLIEKLK